MDIQEIINELTHLKIIDNQTITYEQLSGGTLSKVYLITDRGRSKYVVKLNHPKVLESEANFLDFYMNENILPKLLYADKTFHYIVYSFIPGSTHYSRKNKKEILKTLVQHLINHYKIVPQPGGWGWADELTDSWQSFLVKRVWEAGMLLNLHLEKEELNFVLNLVTHSNRKVLNREPFLLHGDCGVHNFILNEGKLCGVIDPTPVIGDPLYDLIYAFCSSPDDLTKETIDFAASHLAILEDRVNDVLYEEVLIGLYLRLGACIKHHPHDFDEYLLAWNYWKNII